MTKKRKKTSSAFLIGLFVIFGTILMAGAIIWLGAGKFLKKQIYFVTYFETSVEGLDVGSAVKYQGVPAGRIVNIAVAPDGRLVEVIMQINENIEINDALRVQPAMSGIAGGSFLQLHYPTDEKIATIFPEINFEPPYEYIRSAPSSLEEMSLAAREVMNNLSKLDVEGISLNTIKFLQVTSDFFGSDDMKLMMKNFAQASSRFDNILQELDESAAIDNLTKTTEVFYETSLQLSDVVDNLNNQITDARIPYHIEGMSLSFDSTMQHANEIIGVLGYRAQTSILTLQETMNEFRRSNKDLQNVLRGLSDDPSSIFLTEPPPKER
ncbi:MAG: MlaD family protein [Candidatus Kapabacteria bacterium]|nr:MlaD family protein [Candidatus Kapabacteria bacterium]